MPFRGDDFESTLNTLYTQTTGYWLVGLRVEQVLQQLILRLVHKKWHFVIIHGCLSSSSPHCLSFQQRAIKLK